jgi:hypothetical protein
MNNFLSGLLDFPLVSHYLWPQSFSPFLAWPVTASKYDAPAVVQAAKVNLAGSGLSIVGGWMTQITSGCRLQRIEPDYLRGLR